MSARWEGNDAESIAAPDGGGGCVLVIGTAILVGVIMLGAWVIGAGHDNRDPRAEWQQCMDAAHEFDPQFQPTGGLEAWCVRQIRRVNDE